jgi:hypothetical protein
VLRIIVASAWNDCAFPQVPWIALDEGVGISYSYAVAAMNGNMYSGGYAKGNFAFVGVTDAADVNPVASASIWGDTTSNVQNLYVSESSSTGSMTKSWLFKGSAIQVGKIGHGKQTNSIDSQSGLQAMLDKQHIAVKGGFRQLLTLPDGTVWSSANKLNTKDQVPFVMSIDVSSTKGIGAGTTGWAKLMDTGYAGGAKVYSVDGDADGDMIVTFQGCSGYDASATSKDAYGRDVKGAMTGCSKHVTKLKKTDGSEVWKHAIPTTISSCRTITDGSFFCGWSMSAKAGTLDFGNSITVVSKDSHVGIVKYNAGGIAQWAKATAKTSFGGLAVSKAGTLLAVIGSPPTRGSAAVLSRIDTSVGNEGEILWSDPGGVGTHGLRGVEVTDDDKEVFVMGQVTKTETLEDATGKSTTLRTRGSYEVFVAAYDAADGSGKYAMDGGGTGMEYFFAMASDPVTHDIYVGGTSRSEHISWGGVKRKNVMYNGQPGLNNPDTSSAVGSSKAFVVKLKTTLTVPSCLTTCNTAFPLQASDVKSGHCYIDRHCYTEGTSSPYSGFECTKCESAVNPLAWSSPDTSDACFIKKACVKNGAHAQVSKGRSMVDDPCLKCDPSINSTGYSPVAGCKLPSTFSAGCYMDSGAQVMTMAAMKADNETKQTTIASLTTSKTQLNSQVTSLKTEKTILQTKHDGLQANRDSLQAQLNSGESCSDELKIVIIVIVIVSVMLVLTLTCLVAVICKERAGSPMFAPAKLRMAEGTPVVVGSPAAPSNNEDPSAAKAQQVSTCDV